MADEQNTNWQYSTGPESAQEQPVDDTGSPASQEETLTWTAAEFIEHDRGASWYFILILASTLIAAATYFITKDFFAVGAIIVVGVVAAIYASHKPKDLTYELSSSGIRIGEKIYNYNLFRSFSVLHEGQHTSINLEPVKRLMPPMTVYFPPENEDQVTEAMGNYLPMEEHHSNITERLAHRLRF